MSICKHKSNDGICLLHSEPFYKEPCHEGPCHDYIAMTNADRIRSMTDEELAEYLFDRGNGSEYCYGICAYQDECGWLDHAQEFCIEQIVKWLKQEADDGD